MTKEEKRVAMVDFFAAPEITAEFSEHLKRVGEALYAHSELGLWVDFVDSVSVDQAVLCWQIVEKLRTVELPESLRI